MINQNDTHIEPARYRPKEGTPTMKPNKPRTTTYLPLRTWLVLSLILLAIGASAAYMYGKKSVLVDSVLTEDSQIVATVGTHILLPKDVVPKIGKMVNVDQFKNDPFLSQANVGDYVLFYPHEGRTVKAILWRPSEKKIVDVSLVSIPTPAL